MKGPMMFNANEEVAPTVTFALSIGRNVGAEPMSTERWGQFKSEIDHALSVFGATLYSKAESKGQFQGMPEHGCIWLGTISGHAMRIALKPHLAKLARIYSQEAIGLVEQADTHTLIFASA